MAPTCFDLRPSSGSLQLSLVKVILILKHSVKLRLNAVVWQHATTPSRNKLRCNLTEFFNINVPLGRLSCKLPGDSRRPKHVGAT